MSFQSCQLGSWFKFKRVLTLHRRRCNLDTSPVSLAACKPQFLHFGSNMISLEMLANATCWASPLIVTNRIPAKTLAIAPARFIPFSSLLKISFSTFLAPVVVCLDGCLPSASASGVAFALLRFRSAAASDRLEICCSCLSFPSSCCGNFELSSAVHVEAGLRSGWGGYGNGCKGGTCSPPQSPPKPPASQT